MQSICAVEFCDRDATAKGLCGGHYRQQKLGKPFTPLREYKTTPNTRVCEFDGCGRVTQGKRNPLCRAHARQVTEGRRIGPVERRLTGLSLSDRIAANTIREGGCLVWQGAKSSGYARLTIENEAQHVHRLVWEQTHGPVAEGMVIDHKCGNRACVEPTHLHVVTYRENAENLRGAHEDSATGVRGVYLHGGRYRGEVHADGVRVFAASFDTLEDAAEAVRAARLAHHTNNLRDRA